MAGKIRTGAAGQRGREGGAALVLLLMVLSCSGGGRDAGRGSPSAAAPPSAATSLAAADSTPIVLFLGTSLTAGQGVPEDQAYPALIQRKIDSAGLDYRVVNAGVSGQTSAGGLRELEWILPRRRVDVLVLELGANDGLRGQSVDSMQANLQTIIDRTRAADSGVAVVIAGMEAPPNMGPRYTARFRAVFPRLARTDHAALIPFLLEGVAAVADLNQPDGIHPTVQGHRIIADNVWRVLEPVLRRRAGLGP